MTPRILDEKALQAREQEIIDAAIGLIQEHGVEHIMTNMELLKPGVSFKELVFGGHELAPEYDRLKYGCRMHGVGLCDEWPLITYPDKYVEGAFDYELEPGMMLCVEALISPDGGIFRSSWRIRF